MEEVNIFVVVRKSPSPEKNATNTKGLGRWMELEDVITYITLTHCLEHLTLEKLLSAVPRVGKN